MKSSLKFCGRVYRNFGYQLAEFCLMSGITALEQASAFIEYEGLEHYEAGSEGCGGGACWC